MFHLDYLSCFLTVLATVLLGRKHWTGLVVAIVNSLIVCVIGFHTSQYGFIPANVFCVCVYGFSIRNWLKEPEPARLQQPESAATEASTDAPQLSSTTNPRPRSFFLSPRNRRQGSCRELVSPVTAKALAAKVT
jgi:hypothetical protein